MSKPDVAAFFDARTGSVQYIVSDPATKRCAIVDPVLDYDEKSGTTATRNADKLLALAVKQHCALGVREPRIHIPHARVVASIRLGHSTISAVDQNGTPGTTAALTGIPRARHASITL